MNTGEGLRNAALAKHGSAGIYLFGDPEPKKTKKFSYKKRAQKFSLRGGQSRAEEDPWARSAKSTGVIVRQDVATENKNKENSENNESEKRKPSVDFVKKNAMSVRKGKDAKSSKRSASRRDNASKKDSDTVTLTKEQLHAILAAIGTSAQLEAAMAVRGSDGAKPEEGNYDSKPADSPETKRPATKQEEKKDAALEGETPKSEETGVKGDAVSKEPVSKTEELTSERNKVVQSRAEQLQHRMADDNYYSAGMGHIGTTGYNDRSLADKKRQQWKLELAEQVGLKRQEQDTHKSLRKVLERETPQSYGEWDPFGRAGAGAPNKNYAITTTEYKPVPQPRHATQPTSEPAERGAPSRAQPSPDKVPAAMRSSFVLGEGSPRQHQHSAAKRQERHQWLEELEKQRHEMRERKEREKREHLDGFQETWADQMDTIRGQPQNPRYQTVAGPTQVVDDASIRTKMTHKEPELNVTERELETQSKSAPQTADPGYDEPIHLSVANPNNTAGEIIHARGRGHQSLMDPTEKERLEKARQKQLEHQMAIKAQVEEKLRLKREEEETQRREEMEEERKLTSERAELQSRFQSDQLKLKQKEEESDRKTTALMMSMQAAQEQAAKERHTRRMQHLIDGGHDIKNLQKSWDAHHSPDVSPRGMALPEEKFSPRAGVVDPSTLMHPVHGEEFSAPHRIDEPSASPVKEQAFQTEFRYSNPNGLPPNLERIAREESAGVEFKFKSKTKPNRSDNTDRGRRHVKEVKSNRKVVRSPSPVEEIPKQHYKKLSERPQSSGINA